jgi:large subunit ribosomal protein L4e
MILTHIYSLPSAKITNPDITRLINSDEIQSVVRPAGSKIQKRPWTQHKNPLKNKGVLFRLNPYAKTLRRQELRELFKNSPLLSYLIIRISPVKQERQKKSDKKKPKVKSAGDAFLKTMFAP